MASTSENALKSGNGFLVSIPTQQLDSHFFGKLLDVEAGFEVYAFGMRISELAEQAGIAPSTVRYYERIGLMPAPGRTASGYREYDADAAARLLFVTRAKRIGLTLEQIADLVAVWNGANCSATHDRMTTLIETKRADVVNRIRELEQFGNQLDEVRATLDEHPPPESCRPDLSCCVPETPDSSAIVVELLPTPRR
jgi:DNA-binding transcriptional MerR regulator